MKRPVLALFERSLRVEMRSVLMCLARIALPVLLFFVLPIIAMETRIGGRSAPGRDFFMAMSWINFVLITLGGLSYFASAITEEKEEMMLGLLRMTSLSPAAILFGKSTSRQIGALLILLTQLPFALLAFTLGGVSRLQIVATYVALGAYLVLLGNIALLCSVLFRRTFTAAFVTAVLLLLLLAVPPMAVGILQAVSQNQTIAPAVMQAWKAMAGCSPIAALSTINGIAFTGPVVRLQVIANLAGGVFFFLVAWALFDRFTRNEKEESPVRIVLFRGALRKSRVPSRIVGASAITWKELRFTAGGWRGAVGKFLLLGLLIGVICLIPYAAHERVNLRLLSGRTMMIVALIAGAIGLAFDAARVFRIEVRWKTLSSLMALPFSVREIAYRKVVGCLFGLIPFAMWFAVGAAIAPDSLGEAAGEVLKHGEAILALVFALLQFVFFLHLVALLSLLIKRGALPLAIVIHWLGGTFASMVTLVPMPHNASPEGFLAAMSVMTMLLIGLLHWAIGARLAYLTGRD